MIEDKKEPQTNHNKCWVGGPNNKNETVDIKSEKSTRSDEDTQKTATGNLPKETPAMNHKKQAAQTHMGQIKLTEVTSDIFATLDKGDICRYGTTGWILRCPKCAELIITEDDTHKTYTNRDNTVYRLSPSLVCPHGNCNWHVWGTISPETITEEEAKAAIEKDNEDDNEEFILPLSTHTAH